MSRCITTGIVALLIGGALGYFGANYMPAKICKAGILNENQCALRRGMDKLWADHVIWTRQFIVSSVAKIGDVDAVVERLMKNQEDIGNAIAPYYGQEAAAALTKLLKEHIAIAGDIVKAALAKNDAQVKALDEKWHANSTEIAALLSGANPAWTKDALESMLFEHLKLTTQELQYRAKGDWKADIANFDAIFEQARMMGKALTDGIVKQFPGKF